jgi:glycosyltransferase involved in cell wall biosynthesis
MVVIIGNPYFSEKLAAGLNKYNSRKKYIFLQTEGSYWGKLKFVASLLFADVVYLVGGDIYSSKLIDISLWARKNVIMHWIGSDVLTAVKKFHGSKINSKYIKMVRHFSEIEWIYEELKSIGIESEIVKIAAIEHVEEEKIPELFSVLTYIGKGREVFYGIESIIMLAYDFPNIKFVVAGISNYASHADLPANIIFIGWVDDMTIHYKNSSIYLRLVEHDGLAFSVLEALSMGRYVGYTQKLPATKYVKTYDDLKEFLIDAHLKYVKGILQPNKAGCDFVRDNYSAKRVFSTLADKLSCK